MGGTQTTENDAAARFERPAPHVARIVLNRPAQRNAIDADMARLVAQFVREVESDDGIRVAILAASGDAAFCAGGDLKAIARGEGAKIFTRDGGLAGFVDARRSKPWIAAVRGYALGGGAELALACDMIVCAETASFSLPEVKRGRIAGAGGVWRLARVLPLGLATELALTGDAIDGKQAAAFGLANRAVPAEELDAAVLALAERIAANAPVSVRESLALARQSHDLDEPGLRAASYAAWKRVSASDDAKEGPLAFLEKRAPRWTGK